MPAASACITCALPISRPSLVTKELSAIFCDLKGAALLKGKTLIPFFTYDATTYLNESMQQIYRLTPHSRHIPSTLPEDLDPGDITTPGRADDEVIDMPGNAAGVKTWLKRIGMLP